MAPEARISVGSKNRLNRIPIALGYELVPAATADMFAAVALVTNAAGNFLGFGVVVPLYAVAILTTRALPRWIGWLGLLVGVLAGWWGLRSPNQPLPFNTECTYGRRP